MTFSPSSKFTKVLNKPAFIPVSPSEAWQTISNNIFALQNDYYETKKLADLDYKHEIQNKILHGPFVPLRKRQNLSQRPVLN